MLASTIKTALIKTAVIPCAGWGTRWFPVTKLVPKELLPVGTKPAILHVVEELVALGIQKVVLVCNPHKLSIADFFNPNPALNGFLSSKKKTEDLALLKSVENLVEISVVYQEEALGLGHAIGCAREEITDHFFFVALPDVLLLSGYQDQKKWFQKCGAENRWGLLLQKVPCERISSYGVVEVEGPDEDGFYLLKGAVEKPKPDEAPSDFGIIGRYILPQSIFEVIDRGLKGALGEIQITDAIQQLLAHDPACGFVNTQLAVDVGVPGGVEEVWKRR